MRAQMVGWFVLCFLLIVLCRASNADVIHTISRMVEGRVLEDSSQILVVETVAGEYVKVEKSTIRSIEREPREEFYFRRANFHESKGNENAALNDYRHVVQQNANHKRAANRIETITYTRKKEQWDAKLSEAENLRSTENYRSALTVYQEVLDMEPEPSITGRVIQQMSDTHAQMAFLFYDHCYDRGALVELARAEELNPNNADIYYVLGKINYTDHKYATARLYFERTIQLNPNHSAARENLSMVIDRTRKNL